MNACEEPPDPKPSAEADPDPPGVRRMRAIDLLGPARLLRIEHGGETYTLRITRNDRLILTK